MRGKLAILLFAIIAICFGISMLNNIRDIEFTYADVERNKCVGCYCPYFKVVVEFYTSEYCCRQDIDVKRQKDSDCYSVSECKKMALDRLDFNVTSNKIFTIVGSVSIGIGGLSFMIVFIILTRRVMFIIRLQQRLEALRSE